MLTYSCPQETDRALVPVIRTADFTKQVLDHPTPVLVACLRRDLEPAEQLELLALVAKAHGPALKVCVIDALESYGFRKDYKVLGTPTYLIFQDGREVERMLGKADIESLYFFLDHVLAMSRCDPAGAANSHHVAT
jgi:thioredoxin-like negative regulator of GroEL